MPSLMLRSRRLAFVSAGARRLKKLKYARLSRSTLAERELQVLVTVAMMLV